MPYEIERTGVVIEKRPKLVKVNTTQIGVGPITFRIATHKDCVLEVGQIANLAGEKFDFRRCKKLGIFALACIHNCPANSQCPSFYNPNSK